MSNLGDVLAEHFQIKAKLIRNKLGLKVVLIWLAGTIFLLVSRVIFTVWILKRLDAPAWLWWMGLFSIFVGIIIEETEKK